MRDTITIADTELTRKEFKELLSDVVDIGFMIYNVSEFLNDKKIENKYIMTEIVD
jgi:hypothetical protein